MFRQLVSKSAAFGAYCLQQPHIKLFSTRTIPAEIENFIKSNKITMYMKGTPQQPMCGFSRAVCQILEIHEVPSENISTVNVLEDNEIREGIKEYTSWPTIPQVFFDGEFVGGCDIMLDYHKSGDLVDMLDKIGIKSALQESEV